MREYRERKALTALRYTLENLENPKPIFKDHKEALKSYEKLYGKENVHISWDRTISLDETVPVIVVLNSEEWQGEY